MQARRASLIWRRASPWSLPFTTERPDLRKALALAPTSVAALACAPAALAHVAGGQVPLAMSDHTAASGFVKGAKIRLPAVATS